MHFDPCCSPSDLLPRRFAVARLPVVVFFDGGHPRFWSFYSTIPVDVVREKSYINCILDPAHVVTRVTSIIFTSFQSGLCKKKNNNNNKNNFLRLIIILISNFYLLHAGTVRVVRVTPAPGRSLLSIHTWPCHASAAE